MVIMKRIIYNTYCLLHYITVFVHFIFLKIQCLYNNITLILLKPRVLHTHTHIHLSVISEVKQ